MITAIIFIIVLAVLIFVHELGHFLVARWCGIRVDAFAIGFGPKIFGWKRGGVEYSLRLIPFGGYVKIFGENPDEENTKGPDAHRSFVNKKKIVQIAVLVAGVSFNFIFAWLLYIGIFTSGMNVDAYTYEKYTGKQADHRVMITGLTRDLPADKAGLKVGDIIIAMSVKNIEGLGSASTSITEIVTVQNIQDTINSNGNTIAVSYIRDNDIRNTEVTPVKGVIEGKYAIGIAMGEIGGRIRFSFQQSVWESMKYAGTMIKAITVGLFTFIGDVFTGTAKFSDVTGPLGIAKEVGDAAHRGFQDLILLTAFISLNLGVINLLPFPALDGGRVLFVIIEAIIRRPIPMKWANIVNTIGFILLMGLMVVVTFKDVLRIFK